MVAGSGPTGIEVVMSPSCDMHVKTLAEGFCGWVV